MSEVAWDYFDTDECTCGHYYDDHVGDVCSFYGCGCGYAGDEADSCL